MSTVTTTPEMDTPAATLPDARLRAEGSSDRLGKSAGLDGDPPAERRRSRCPSDSPIDFLEGLSAVVVLERIPVPLVAIAWDGVIVFANPAFAEMVATPGRASGVGVFGDLPHRARRGMCLLRRRCAGEPGGGVTASGGLEGAGQADQVSANALRRPGCLDDFRRFDRPALVRLAMCPVARVQLG